MIKQMRTGQRLTATIVARKADGTEGRLDGAPQWASSDPSVATVEPSEDGMSCIVRSVATGTAQVSVTGDADLGLGIRPVVGVLDIVVAEQEVVTIEIQAGDPVDEVPAV